jgi:hypothetical protein
MNRHYFLAIGWTLGILLACSIPGNDLPDLDLDLLKADKLAHFTLFLGFGWLWLRAIPRGRRFRWAGVLAVGLVYAVATEWYQGILPWDRTPDPLDAAANTVGLFTSAGIHRWRERRETP